MSRTELMQQFKLYIESDIEFKRKFGKLDFNVTTNQLSSIGTQYIATKTAMLFYIWKDLNGHG